MMNVTDRKLLGVVHPFHFPLIKANFTMCERRGRTLPTVSCYHVQPKQSPRKRNPQLRPDAKRTKLRVNNLGYITESTG